MAYVRQLPSGKWQATVRHPAGHRLTKTDPLRRVVAAWARDLEAQFARGDVRDPRAGKISVREWYERWFAAHVCADSTRTKIEGRWRVHCEPKWGDWPMQAITRMEAQQWVRQLEVTPRVRWGGRRVLDEDDAPYLGPGTIAGIVQTMTTVYNSAMGETPPVVLTNPFLRLALPTIPPGRIVFYSHEEHEQILVAMRELGIDLRWRVFCDLAAWVGLRYGEIAGLPGDNVGWLRNEINVWQVWTPGGIRPYAKTKKSFRTVPVPERIIEGMSRLMHGRDRSELVFAGPRSRHAWHSYWYDQWYAAVNHAGVSNYPPHVLRHTAASWLVMDGVDLRRVQALLGHERYSTTERYAHLAPDAHDKIRDAWRARDARTTHEAQVIDLDARRKAG